MTKPYYKSEDVTLYNENAYDFAKSLAEESIDCIVTSPPYWNLRDYETPGQWGNEKNIVSYVDRLVTLFGMMRRALKSDGTLWLNLGDTRIDRQLCGVPWRVAHSLQEDGWHLRQEVIWHKPNGMPEPVKDRPSMQHETVFLLSKSSHHFFDLDCLRVKYDGDRSPSRRARTGNTNKANSATGAWSGEHSGRNPGSVWSISTQPWPGAHCAVMPMELAKRLVMSGSPHGGIVVDPFHGSGTTGEAAVQLGRRYIGNDLNREYLDLSLRTRLQTVSLGI